MWEDGTAFQFSDLGHLPSAWKYVCEQFGEDRCWANACRRRAGSERAKDGTHVYTKAGDVDGNEQGWNSRVPR
jgi:hypothetical protein